MQKRHRRIGKGERGGEREARERGREEETTPDLGRDHTNGGAS